MTEHPITPPPELLQQWAVDYWGNPGETIGAGEKYIAIQAARWGADAELEACCNAIYEREDQPLCGGTAEWLRAIRRPKPQSLAEEAKAELQSHQKELRAHGLGFCSPAISAALERLQQLEQESHV